MDSTYRRRRIGAGFLLLGTAALAASGLFAIAQSVSGAFLPHDHTDPLHLGPAVLGALVLAAGLALSAPLPVTGRVHLPAGAGAGFR